MPKIEPCKTCGDSTVYPHDGDSCILTLAIRESECPYCLAASGEPCVSAYGKVCPQWHIGRVGAGHRLLVAKGTPAKVSALIVKNDDNKGHTREHWAKRRREAGR